MTTGIALGSLCVSMVMSDVFFRRISRGGMMVVRGGSELAATGRS